MVENLSKFEQNVYLLHSANTPISTIVSILKKNSISINNALYRIKKKLTNPPPIKRVNRGRISKVSLRTKRQINRDLERSPKKTNKRLLLENNIPISNRALQRLLKEEGWIIKIANKKAFLDKKKALKRVSYCKEHLRKLKNQEFNLKKIIFSDESGIEAGKSGKGEIYRKRGKKEPGKKRISNTTTSKFRNIPNRLKLSVFLVLSFYKISFLIATILTF